MKKTLFITFIIISFSNLYGQNFLFKQQKIFLPQNKKVNLYENTNSKKLILFESNLNVNTDGVPKSYHPLDLRGDSLAINTILNGVAIYRKSDNIRISNPKKPNTFSDSEKLEMRREAYSIFEKWRDSDYDLKQPDGYTIIWNNVLISENNKPCVLKEGEYKGYYASATKLKNELKENKGECECNNQVDPFKVPTLVLAKKHPKFGDNPVSTFGAQVGDLLIAYNPKNNKLVYAIIGDIGPEDNLGEGSVILNMMLTNKNEFPKTRKETYNYTTDKDIIICIIPNSKKFEKRLPYTCENIKDRIIKWFSNQNINEEKEIIEFIVKNKSQI